MPQTEELYRMVAAETVIFREGDEGAEMYIIESGCVDIERRARGEDPIARLGPGDFFGEMAILEDQPRFATAIARQPTRLLVIDRAAFPGVIAGNVEIAVRIMRKLAGRLRRSELRSSGDGSSLATVEKPSPQLEATAAAALLRQGQKREIRPTDSPPTPVPQGRRMVLVHSATRSRFELSSGNEFLVGRPDPVTGTTPDVNLGGIDTHRSLSRRHAKIQRDGGIWKLREEVGTLNGTFVNGLKLKSGVAVEFGVGDVLRFGSVDVTATIE